MLKPTPKIPGIAKKKPKEVRLPKGFTWVNSHDKIGTCAFFRADIQESKTNSPIYVIKAIIGDKPTQQKFVKIENPHGDILITSFRKLCKKL